MKALILIVACVVGACGGQIATDGDSGTSNAGSVDASIKMVDARSTPTPVPAGSTSSNPPPTPGNPPCSQMGLSGSGSIGGNGSCGAGATWQCGFDTFDVECDCPAAACTCSQNGVVQKKISYAGCPMCAGNVTAYAGPQAPAGGAGCNFPH